MTRRRTTIGVALTLAAALGVSACGSWSSDTSDAARSAHEPTVTSVPPAPPSSSCDPAQKDDFDAMIRSGGFASVAPGARPAPGAMPDGTFIREIQDRMLVVGVDQNTLQFGYRNPITGDLSGLDIELLAEIARAIFGDDGNVDQHIQFKALSTAERIPAVVSGDVDVVASLITVTCERSRDVAFTSEYYRANQGVMVRRGSPIATTADLTGKRVCATAGSTSLANLDLQVPEARAVPAEARTDCLVMLQQGTVDAITADDTILVSFHAQDPKTKILDVDLSDEPYAIAIRSDRTDFVRFVNGVLEDLRSSSRLAELYQAFLAGDPDAGDAFVPPAVPEPRYADR